MKYLSRTRFCVIKIFFLFSLVSNISFGADLKDVKILKLQTNKQDGLKLTLQEKEAAKESFFYVELSNDGSQSYKKLSEVAKKNAELDKYRLNLEIISFSSSPSGSSYRSNRIVFHQLIEPGKK